MADASINMKQQTLPTNYLRSRKIFVLLPRMDHLIGKLSTFSEWHTHEYNRISTELY